MRKIALVRDNVVVGVSVADAGSGYQAWLSAVSSNFDRVEDITDHPYPVNRGDTWTEADGYRPTQPFPSWVWSETEWTAPVPMPDDGGVYRWDEEGQSWVMVVPPPSGVSD